MHIRQKFFVDRVINVWNALPSTVNFTSLHVFRNSINKIDFSSFLVCNKYFTCVIEYVPVFFHVFGQLLWSGGFRVNQGSFPVRKRTGTLRIWRAREREPIWGSEGILLPKRANLSLSFK